MTENTDSAGVSPVNSKTTAIIDNATIRAIATEVASAMQLGETGASNTGQAVAVDAGSKPPLLSRLTPRMLACLVMAVAMTAVVAVISPQQLPVSGYKLSLVLVAAFAGYWLDRWAFPYARPDSFLMAADWRAEKGSVQGQANHAIVPGCELIYASSMLRRGAIMLGAMLAMGLGL